MTEYRMADGAGDYRRCHQLIKEEGWPEHEISFPNIMAIKDGELVGLLATHIVDKMIIAGPLVLKRGAPRYWTLIRLIENYENVMRAAGVTRYIFAVPSHLKVYLDQIDRTFGLKSYAEKDGHKFFERIF